MSKLWLCIYIYFFRWHRYYSLFHGTKCLHSSLQRGNPSPEYCNGDRSMEWRRWLFLFDCSFQYDPCENAQVYILQAPTITYPIFHRLFMVCCLWAEMVHLFRYKLVSCPLLSSFRKIYGIRLNSHNDVMKASLITLIRRYHTVSSPLVNSISCSDGCTHCEYNLKKIYISKTPRLIADTRLIFLSVQSPYPVLLLQPSATTWTLWPTFTIDLLS